VEQAYRYPIETWTEAEARKHCQDHEGTFEVATKQEGDKMAQDENTVSSAYDEIVKRRQDYDDVDVIITKVKALTSQLKTL